MAAHFGSNVRSFYGQYITAHVACRGAAGWCLTDLQLRWFGSAVAAGKHVRVCVKPATAI